MWSNTFKRAALILRRVRRACKALAKSPSKAQETSCQSGGPTPQAIIPEERHDHLFDRLPVELLSLVFFHGALSPCRPPRNYFTCKGEWDPTRLEPVQFAVMVSLVCRHWRAVALVTPALWSKVIIPSHHPYHMRQACKQLRRVGNFPIQLSIPFYENGNEYNGMFPIPDIFLLVVRDHLKHCQSLLVKPPGTKPVAVFPDFLVDRTRAPILEYLNYGKEIELGEQEAPPNMDPPRLDFAALHFDPSQFPRTHIVLRSLASTLHSLELVIHARSNVDLVNLDILEFPSLCHLSLFYAKQEIFSKISAPFLRSLCFVSSQFPTDNPGVAQTLRGVTHLGFTPQLPEDGVRYFYNMLPSLRVLYVDLWVPAYIRCLLVNSRDHARLVPCPRLHTIIIRYYPVPAKISAPWKEIHRLARERHTQGLPIRQLFLDPRQDAVHRHAERLRAFVADVQVLPMLKSFNYVPLPQFEIEGCPRHGHCT